MQGRLQDFLTKIHADLTKEGGSQEYRRDVADKLTTTIAFKQAKVLNTIKSALNRAVNPELETYDRASLYRTIQPALKKELKQTFNEIRANFTALKNRGNNFNRVIFLGGTDRKNRMTLRIKLFKAAGTYGEGKDIFLEAKRQYEKPLQKFYDRFLDKLPALEEQFKRASTSSSTGESDMNKATQVFNLEHLGGSSNIEAFIADTIFHALDECFDPNDEAQSIQEAIDQVGLGKYIRVEKIAKTGELNIFLGDQQKNVAQSAEEKKKKTNLVTALTKAIEKLGPHRLDGSDSLQEAQRKLALERILNKFMRSGAVIAKQENTKIKEGRSATKSFNSKVKKSAKGVAKPAFKRRQTRMAPSQKGVSASPLALLALINKQLPDAVRSNMGAPALENQTGRFAQSVRLTDVGKTAQGFTSYGYTYQKSPYQVFETTSGSRFASSDRDPRKLIDKSIRQVAAQYAVGRFYTRRE